MAVVMVAEKEEVAEALGVEAAMAQVEELRGQLKTMRDAKDELERVRRLEGEVAAEEASAAREEAWLARHREAHPPSPPSPLPLTFALTRTLIGGDGSLRRG